MWYKSFLRKLSLLWISRQTSRRRITGPKGVDVWMPLLQIHQIIVLWSVLTLRVFALRKQRWTFKWTHWPPGYCGGWWVVLSFVWGAHRTLGDRSLGSVTLRVSLWTNRVSITWELIRNAGSWAPAHTCWTRHSGGEAHTVWVTKPSRGFPVSAEAWEPGSRMMTGSRCF